MLSAERPLRPVSVLSMPGMGSLQCRRSRDWTKGKDLASFPCNALGFRYRSLTPSAACQDLHVHDGHSQQLLGV